jgi:ADP-heptose:LPS heptosyltransferase
MPTCLVIKNDGIGDLVLASGLIGSISERFGGQVDLVTCEDNREIAEGIDPLRERLYVSRDSMHFSTRAWSLGILWPRMPASDARVLDAIRSRTYDVAIVLRRFVRQNSLVIMRAVRANRRVCAWQLPTNAPAEMARRASVGWERYSGPLDTVSELTYATGFAEAVFGGAFSTVPTLSYCTRQTSLPGHRKVVLGLSGNSTNWPFGNWIELAMLLAADGWNLTLVGGDNVAELAGQLERKVPGAENLVGRLSIRETVRVLDDCDAYIGNDTGISHLAGLVVRNCLIVAGGGTFRRFFPWPGARNQTVLYHALDCFDCEWLCKFSERYCLSLVRAGDAFAAFQRMMTANPAAPAEINLNPMEPGYEVAWRHDTGVRMPFSGRVR